MASAKKETGHFGGWQERKIHDNIPAANNNSEPTQEDMVEEFVSVINGLWRISGLSWCLLNFVNNPLERSDGKCVRFDKKQKQWKTVGC